MDYTSELKAMLRPLGLYDLNSGVGAAEIEAEGRALDTAAAALEKAGREGILMTAEDEGLGAFEALLPFVPVFCTTAEERRRAIAALLRIDYAAFTPQAVNDTVNGCGIEALVEETDTPLTVQVSFPRIYGEPDDLEALKVRIERILPCHLGIVYVFRYAAWAEVEAKYPAWADIAAPGNYWRRVERLGT